MKWGNENDSPNKNTWAQNNTKVDANRSFRPNVDDNTLVQTTTKVEDTISKDNPWIQTATKMKNTIVKDYNSWIPTTSKAEDISKDNNEVHTSTKPQPPQPTKPPQKNEIGTGVYR